MPLLLILICCFFISACNMNSRKQQDKEDFLVKRPVPYNNYVLEGALLSNQEADSMTLAEKEMFARVKREILGNSNKEN